MQGKSVQRLLKIMLKLNLKNIALFKTAFLNLILIEKLRPLQSKKTLKIKRMLKINFLVIVSRSLTNCATTVAQMVFIVKTKR